MEAHIGRDIPPYAILSHTWEDEEVTLQDWDSPMRDSMKGFRKIRETCRLAAGDGIKYAWVDTCCIDKSNSAELSEAINSMYRWYKGAQVCYAYLADLRLPASVSENPLAADLTSLLRECRWFSRGWTLQELIAPATLLFYQHDWRLIGNKKDWSGMLTDVTAISPNAIFHYDPQFYTIAERMSWAAGRETTREEDIAYCLLGIFNVNMPMLYGEGAKAFRRLQEEILRNGYDVSIFSWTRPFFSPEEGRSYAFGAFADTPGDFHSIRQNLIVHNWNDVSVTNVGVKLTLELFVLPGSTDDEGSYHDGYYVLPLCTGGWGFTVKDRFRMEYLPALGVKLNMIGPGRFARMSHDRLVELPDDLEADMVRRIRCPDAHILIDATNKTVRSVNDNVHRYSFSFPSGCRVVKAWPSGRWDYAGSTFMTVAGEPIYGSFLLQVQSPTLADDGPAGQCRTGEFMFLFSRLHDRLGPDPDLIIDPVGLRPIIDPDRPRPNWQHTIVGYREHQLALDTISLRLAAGDMDVQEMRRTLMNFAIPKQRTAAVPVEGTEQYIYTSVDVCRGDRYTFESSPVAPEIKEQPRGTKT